MDEEEKNYSEMTATELTRDYSKSLVSYSKWIDKEIDVNEDWVEEMEFMSFYRAEIHKIVEELDKRNIAWDKEKLMVLDAKWQTWILNHNDPDFKLEHSRQGKPKVYWWEWIDQLDSLTQEQRRTL